MNNFVKVLYKCIAWWVLKAVKFDVRLFFVDPERQKQG